MYVPLKNIALEWVNLLTYFIISYFSTFFNAINVNIGISFLSNNYFDFYSETNIFTNLLTTEK